MQIDLLRNEVILSFKKTHCGKIGILLSIKKLNQIWADVSTYNLLVNTVYLICLPKSMIL
jgi:hypothetical protein